MPSRYIVFQTMFMHACGVEWSGMYAELHDSHNSCINLAEYDVEERPKMSVLWEHRIGEHM